MKINILEYLEQHSNSTGCALSDETESITYSQFINMAQRIGTYIARQDNWNNKPIAVLIDRNIWSIVLFMFTAATFMCQ